MLNAEIAALEEQETRVMAEGFIDKVNIELTDIKHSFFRIGFLLSEANELGYYESLGYQNITELAEDKFGFKKTVTYELMQIYALAHSEQTPMQIADKYEKYSKSQLTEFCRLRFAPDSFIKMVSPKDSVAKIKPAVTFWNKYTEKNSCTPEVNNIDELLLLAEKAEKQRTKNNQLPGQTVIDISEVQNVEEFNAVNSFSEYSENSEVVDEPETVAAAPAPAMTDGELIGNCLKAGIGCGLNGKFEIYGFYNEKQPYRIDFAKFIKDVYGNGGYGDGIWDIDYTPSKGMTIKRADGSKISGLPWPYIANKIVCLIKTGEYLNIAEQAQYVQWKAERDGLIVNVEPAAEPVSESSAENSESSENDEADEQQTRRMLLEKLTTTELAKEICNHIYAKSIGYTDFMPPENLMREWLINWLDEVVE